MYLFRNRVSIQIEKPGQNASYKINSRKRKCYNMIHMSLQDDSCRDY